VNTNAEEMFCLLKGDMNRGVFRHANTRKLRLIVANGREQSFDFSERHRRRDLLDATVVMARRVIAAVVAWAASEAFPAPKGNGIVALREAAVWVGGPKDAHDATAREPG
jgi:hypothetical protein